MTSHQPAPRGRVVVPLIVVTLVVALGAGCAALHPRKGSGASALAGLVLTNNHVIRDATTVTARLTSTGRTYSARIVGTDADADIAVLQLSGATGLTPAPVGDSAG
jgi:Trypsin-like peptidase domain